MKDATDSTFQKYAQRARHQLILFVQAVREGDESTAAQAVLELSQRRKLFMPLAFIVGGIAMLFNGLRLLFSNWRLLLVQMLPAMWIWLAMLDLKAHVLHGEQFHTLNGPELPLAIILITAITAASFFLNAVFAFAIVQPGKPLVKPAFSQALTHRRVILSWGAGVGILLALSAAVVPRWGYPWFTISMGAIVGIMMIAYVAVPSRLIGANPKRSTRDKLSASAVGGAIGAVVCAPPYILGRIGILMLGTNDLFVLGILLIAVGVILQAGATGAVKAVKMSAKLIDADALPATVRSPPQKTA